MTTFITKTAIYSALVSASLVGMTASSHAQINPFGGYKGPALTNADLDAGIAAAARLLGDNPKPVGAVEAWAGPSSGNSGTMAVEHVYTRQGQPCRTLRSTVTYKEGKKLSYLLKACRVSGAWKLM